MSAELVEVEEGRARLLLPEAERGQRGPGSKATASVFFNPAMSVNRDLSALLLRTQARDGWTTLDGLAATGVRGIRYGLEAGAKVQVEWNDWNPVAVRLIEQNAKRNSLEPLVTQRNLAALLHEKIWSMVDIDPYGSPAPFLDGASRAVRHGGILGLTATDTKALAGVNPKAALRRYGGLPLHGELGHDVALRLVVAAAVRAGARHDVGLEPVLAHATDHYYRVLLRARRNATSADMSVARLEHVFLCRACGERGFDRPPACPTCGERVRVGGPVWSGNLNDRHVVDDMVAQQELAAFARPQESQRLLEQLSEESRAPAMFFDLDKLGERERIGSTRMADVLEKLREHGFAACRAHFHPRGVRTSASARDLARIVRETVRA